MVLLFLLFLCFPFLIPSKNEQKTQLGALLALVFGLVDRGRQHYNYRVEYYNNGNNDDEKVHSSSNDDEGDWRRKTSVLTKEDINLIPNYARPNNKNKVCVCVCVHGSEFVRIGFKKEKNNHKGNHSWMDKFWEWCRWLLSWMIVSRVFSLSLSLTTPPPIFTIHNYVPKKRGAWMEFRVMLPLFWMEIDGLRRDYMLNVQRVMSMGLTNCTKL